MLCVCVCVYVCVCAIVSQKGCWSLGCRQWNTHCYYLMSLSPHTSEELGGCSDCEMWKEVLGGEAVITMDFQPNLYYNDSMQW